MKKLLFDTSILIAGLVTSHPKHHVALPWLQRAKAKEIAIMISTHTLAESFAVLTRLPLSPRISPETARYLLRENIENIAKIIALSTQDYQNILKRMTELSLSGGIIYDAISVKAAEKAKVNHVLTLNREDFIRLKPENPEFILSP